LTQLYPRSVTKSYSYAGQLEVFLDVHVPPPELAIFGAGHDAIPMANFAHGLGYNVTLIDARHAFVNKERFPTAKTLIRSHPSGFAEKVRLGPRSYALIMNHHLERDKDCLAFALQSAAPYIGVLGPRSRYKQILENLEQEGLRYSPEELARVRNPIGVDVGADTPEEIAISVLAELLAVRGGYQAGFLNEHEGKIHALRD
jgi:xanthine/CO dehydrogenase XdhC/CoxF family maturation factor